VRADSRRNKSRQAKTNERDQQQANPGDSIHKGLVRKHYFIPPQSVVLIAIFMRRVCETVSSYSSAPQHANVKSSDSQGVRSGERLRNFSPDRTIRLRGQLLGAP
jgi:hypothetical protein